jgi:hypothetical protein
MIEKLVVCKAWEGQTSGSFTGSSTTGTRRTSWATANFVMGDPTHKMWFRSLRNVVLDTAWAVQHTLGPTRRTMIENFTALLLKEFYP